MIDEAEIRYLGDVQRLALKPGDIVVVKLPGRNGVETCQRVHDHMIRHLGGEHKVIVLSDGVEIEVLAPEPA